MRKSLSFLVVAAVLVAAPAVQAGESGALLPTPVQAVPMPPSGTDWTAGKIASVGAGVVAGVMAANAFLPVTWGMAAPMLGSVAGAMVGNWGYNRVAGPPTPMLRKPASMEAEAPSLFHLAVANVD